MTRSAPSGLQGQLQNLRKRAGGQKGPRRNQAQKTVVATASVLVTDTAIYGSSGGTVTSAPLQPGVLIDGTVTRTGEFVIALKSVIESLGQPKGKIALSLPSHLFTLDTISMMVPDKSDPQVVIDNNLANLIPMRPNHYGRYSHSLIKTGEYQVTQISADLDVLRGYVEAFTAIGARVVAIEPRMLSEMRCAVMNAPDHAVVLLHGEVNSTVVLAAHDGELIDHHSAANLEEALRSVSHASSAAEAFGWLRSNPEQFEQQEHLADLLELLERTDAYLALRNIASPVSSQVSGEFADTRLAGWLSEVIRPFAAAVPGTMQETGFSPDMAIQGMLSRSTLYKGIFGLNLLSPDLIPVKEAVTPAFARFVIPSVILMLGAGSYAYAAQQMALVNAEIVTKTEALAVLKPKVAEQRELLQRNTDIQGILIKQAQIELLGKNWPDLYSAFIDRLPRDKEVTLDSLTVRQEHNEGPEFDGQQVDLIYNVSVRATSRNAILRFIKYYEQDPFVISVTSFVDSEKTHTLTANIGSSNLNPDRKPGQPLAYLPVVPRPPAVPAAPAGPAKTGTTGEPGAATTPAGTPMPGTTPTATTPTATPTTTPPPTSR